MRTELVLSVGVRRL